MPSMKDGMFMQMGVVTGREDRKPSNIYVEFSKKKVDPENPRDRQKSLSPHVVDTRSFTDRKVFRFGQPSPTVLSGRLSQFDV